jgi:hypothetical protein
MGVVMALVIVCALLGAALTWTVWTIVTLWRLVTRKRLAKVKFVIAPESASHEDVVRSLHNETPGR